MITVVGLGRNKDDITQSGKRAVDGAKFLVCRTTLSKAARGLKDRCAASFDELFETCENFDALNEKIASELLRFERENGDIVYCVDGDGFGDASVRVLAEKTEINIIAGVSATRAKKACGGALSISATELIESRPLLDTSVALEITEIDNALLAGEVKLYLGEFYSDSQRVSFSVGDKAQETALEEIDRFKKYDYSASLFIAGKSGYEKDKYCFADVLRIMQRLTAPDGCEWDKAQTHSSIRINMIEEAYEAVAAIINDDTDNLIEELGDVLLQVVFHSDMASRGGEFSFSDVVNGLCTKLVTRHTHIFGQNKADNADAALGFWEKAKAKEKHYNSLADTIDSVPETFPALLYAEKIIKKVSKGGYNVFAQDLAGQLKAAVDKKEIGKALFLCIAFAAAEKSDAEVELMQECIKFAEECKKKLPENGTPVSEIL